MIELLVVLAIAALLVAVAMPRLHRALPGRELAGVSGELAAALGEARSRAIAQGSPRSLVVDIDEGSYRVEDGPARRLPAGMRIDALAESAAIEEAEGRVRFLFYPDGTSVGGRILLARGDRAYSIEIDWLTGRIRVAESEAAR